MKKIYLGFIVIVMTATLNGLYAQVGVGTVSPFGALDVTSTNDGVLISRVALTATNVATVLTPTTSELVYNTATAGAGATAVTPGFYYWNGALWIRIATGQNSDWTLLGNSGTVAATNFVGTTDAIDFVTRTNNTEKTRVTSAGNMGIGTPTPAAKLDVATGATVVNTIVNATGSINDYLQFNIQNTSTGIQSQSGYAATADNGTATSGFAWFGINNSTFNFPTSYNIGGVNDVSLMGSGQDMYVANANNTKSIIFSTGKAVTPFFDERMRITNAGNIGIGTTLPTGLLDLTATDRGIVVPRIALTASNVQAPVINPQGGIIPAGTTIYNTATAGVSPNNVGPGLYFWNGTRWIAFAGSAGGLDWSLTGNASTTPGSYAAPGVNYLGTSDNTALHFSVNGLPRIRITTNGNVGIGQSSVGTTRLIVDAIPTTDSAFRAQGTGSNSATIIPAASIVNTATDYAVGMIANTAAVPTVASPNFAFRASSGTASYIGPSTQSNIAISANATNLAFYGITEGTTATTRRAAEFRTNDAGVATDNDVNDPIAYLAGYATGVDVSGAGDIRSLKYGGYFYGGSATSYAYVGARLTTNFTPTTPVAGIATTNFKIIGAGSVSTIVSGAKESDTKKIMFAPEAPEVLFEDYGTGQLANGSVKIKIDPIFSKNIFVDEKHPLKVFIQLEGDCNGVYVTSKSKNEFTVKELNKGTSNVNFSWHIVGNRADETERNGEKTNYQSLRYPNAPGPLAQTKIESKMVKPSEIDSEDIK